MAPGECHADEIQDACTTMTRVCLIRPCEAVPLRAATSQTPTPPLGLAYIAAAVRTAGHDVQVIDALAEAPALIEHHGDVGQLGLPNGQVVEHIDPSCEVIGVGAMFSHNWPNLRELVVAIRARFPHVAIVAGGEHASALPELVLRESAVDYCVLGEGEETIVELLACLEHGGDPAAVAGIAWRDAAGTVRRNPRRQRIRNVDDISQPAWDLFDVHAYARNRFSMGLEVGDAPVSMPILATRGCPYQCTFCTSPSMWTTAYSKRDAARVADEIEHYVHAYGARNFYLHDLTAIVSKTWIKAFCGELQRRKLDIFWQLPSGTRSEAIDTEVARLLKATGMVHMAYAPESGSDRVRVSIRKMVKAPRFYESVRAAVAAGLHVQVYFVVGFPEERLSDMWASLGMIARLAWMGIGDIAASRYMPYPGSAMYDRLVAGGIVDHSDRWLLAPLHVHSIFGNGHFVVNRNVAPLTVSLFTFASFAVFYGVGALRHPISFLRMIVGIFRRPEHDVSRLQRAFKAMLGTRPLYGQPPPRG